MSSDRGNVIAPRLVLGVGLMILGALFLLDEMRIIDFDDLFRWWPLLPVAVGITMALRPAGSGSRGVGLVLAFGGIWLLLYEFDIVDVDLWEAWPAVLIGLGGWIVWRSLAGTEQSPVSPGSPGGPPAGGDVSAGDTLSAFALLGYARKASVSKSFEAADATAIMGGCTLDLRGADVGADGAVIDAFAFWGGIKILVPEGWVVTNKVLPLLGGTDDRSRAVEGAGKQLLVRGSAIMGGVEIANEDDDD
jgi:hypothetical protein